MHLAPAMQAHCVEPCGELPESLRVAGGWQSSSRAFALSGQVTVGAPRRVDLHELMFKFLLGMRTSPAEEWCKDQGTGFHGGSDTTALSVLQGFTLPTTAEGLGLDVSAAAFPLGHAKSTGKQK